ncbi:unnamed protein product [Hymenolepis diminuta]|uniref:EF-hand domain-containing protein n=1 Tax=Hymenolepis diminuta TaxID=6216 RepID=A0A564YVD6_HYMDI|nr:unnamed protein product [Hymenolepis diminuta]
MPFNFQKLTGKKSAAKDPNPSPSASIPCCSHHRPGCPKRSNELVLRKLISEFDADSDGQFTLSELRQLGHDLCIPYQEVTFKRHFFF